MKVHSPCFSPSIEKDWNFTVMVPRLMIGIWLQRDFSKMLHIYLFFSSIIDKEAGSLLLRVTLNQLDVSGPQQ